MSECSRAKHANPARAPTNYIHTEARDATKGKQKQLQLQESYAQDYIYTAEATPWEVG